MESLFTKYKDKAICHISQNVHQLVNGLKKLVHPNNELLTTQQ